jgi:hypothetical protein
MIVPPLYHSSPDLIVDRDKDQATSDIGSDEAKDKKKMKQIVRVDPFCCYGVSAPYFSLFFLTVFLFIWYIRYWYGYRTSAHKK